MKAVFFVIIIILFSLKLESQVLNTITDMRDGKRYKIVKIGNQTWMAENLAFKADNGCWSYNNDVSKVSKYGYLYNFSTASTICPNGWHLPSDDEWNVLEESFGLPLSMANRSGYRGTQASAIKSKLKILLGGCFENDGRFNQIESRAYFWSSTAQDSTCRWDRIFYFQGPVVCKGCSEENWGLSVRCLKDKL